MTTANEARRNVNLDQLKAEFEKESSYVVKALERVRNASSEPQLTALAHLLRDHRSNGIHGDDIAKREGFDLLLHFYGLVEIGIWTGDFPEQLPERFADDARCVLSAPAVRDYYEVHYPLALPGLLRRRLEGRPVVAAGSQHSSGRFGAFLELSGPLQRDQDIDAFLWLLDGGSYGDVNLTSMIRILRERRDFLNALSTKSPNREYDAAAAVGFSKFLDFCSNFQSLLQRTQAQPMLRAGFWYAHAYWFGQLSDKLRLELDRGIDALAWKRDPWREGREDRENARSDKDPTAVAWRDRSKVDLAESDKTAERARQKLKRVIDALTSGRYASPLRGRIEPSVRKAIHAK